MATQITEPATTGTIGLTDWTNFIDRTTKQGRGYFGVTFSNLDATTESKPQAGSIIENNGSFFQSASEESPTGWSSISNSTQAYMYMDNAGAYSYSTSAPTFSASKNGYYNGTSRAVLKVYKDASGNYTNKGVYFSQNYIAGEIDTTDDILSNGKISSKNSADDGEAYLDSVSGGGGFIVLRDDSGDSKLFLRSVKSINTQANFDLGGVAIGRSECDAGYDLHVDDDVLIGGSIKVSGSFAEGIRVGNDGGYDVGTNIRYIHASSEDGNDIFDKLDGFIPGTNDMILCTGEVEATATGDNIVVARLFKQSSTEIRAYGMLNGSTPSYLSFVDGDTTTTFDLSIAW